MGGMPPATGTTVAIGDVERALSGSKPRRLAIPGFRRAAVLVPLVEEDGGLSILLTVRAVTLRSHAGQIALPGGRLEPGEDSVAAAIRETHEEVGVVVPESTVLGQLSDHPSPAGYVARPVVAAVPWPQQLALDPGEVAEAFLVPLADLRSLTPTSEVRRLNDGMKRRIFSYAWRGRNIWGFTGNVIKELLDVLDGRAEDPFSA